MRTEKGKQFTLGYPPKKHIYTMSQTHNITYNTEKSPIVMTSYGRHVQDLINHCLQIQDRQERTRCAHAIIKVMENQSPQLKQQPNYKQILWDHLAKMANYQLDIDYPVTIRPIQTTNAPQQKPSYVRNNIQYRHYGHLLEKLITTTTQIKHQKQRREYINLTANHMKKSYLTWMRPNVENEQILNDLRQLSRGRIAPNPNEIALRNTKKLLAEIQGSPVSDTPKKKKKK